MVDILACVWLGSLWYSLGLWLSGLVALGCMIQYGRPIFIDVYARCCVTLILIHLFNNIHNHKKEKW